MIAMHVSTNGLCTNCGRVAGYRGPAILHQNDAGEFLGLYCRDPECSAAEDRAWKAGTR